MNKLRILLVAIAFAAEGCASERIYVQVADSEGHPVSNATVTVSFTSGHVVLTDGTARNYESMTGTNGTAVIKFDCDNSHVYWSVKKDGYYTSGPHTAVFKIDEVFIPPVYYNVIMLEHEKHVSTTLWKKVNPVPMYAHYPIERRKLPKENGRYGFDLAEYDWLPPHGRGKEADFYVVREYNNLTEAGTFTVGAVEFERGCGYYVAKNTGCTSFQTAYHADTNAVFKASMPVLCEHRKGTQEYDYPLPLVDKNSHVVLRTRAKYDDNGNMISANYSRILGEFSVLPSVSVAESVFNPVPNDANLEFDPERNLYQGKKGRRIIP